ncbi:MAG: putative unusual protein kinase [Candidatus Atelocyanobacterium thalassa isolate SIO64986]|uniref:Putative unusual protein kinase n=1 Tax=Candidatus Atelocyanobacterium thalassa isolate SIO64986 TaxID=1527444 RepID=A0A086CG39_9CHRO|nr:MAG: putative unusual protein kinase [Candidatus Atelocyanobacterium thalassa isolate SIO64986]
MPALPTKVSSFSSANINSSATNKKYRWNNNNYSNVQRRLDIWLFFLSLMFKLWLNNKKFSYRGGWTKEKLIKRRRILAVWIREKLLDLGPTFIKVGQLFSSRADLFPSEYVEELSKLQDEVPAFNYDEAKKIIEKDLGKPLSQIFYCFDSFPIAAASLGQVHKAILYSGEEVVVKIQRPGLKKLFTIDLAILKQVTYYFQNHPSWNKGKDWISIYNECYKILWLETDYLKEGKNADTFRRNFRNKDWVKVPRVYWRYTASRVLTLEYLPGIKINNYQALENLGLDRKVLAKLNAQAYLHQILNDGFFHADPHPGNIAISEDGALIFYDFGMIGTIESDVKRKLVNTFVGITQKDSNKIISSLIELNILDAKSDIGPARRSIQFMLDNFINKPINEQSITSIGDDLYEIAYNQSFKFPATFTFVMRAFSILEGVGKGLDPDFKFIEVAKPFILDFANFFTENTNNNFLNLFSNQVIEFGSVTLGLPNHIDNTLRKFDQGDIKLGVRSIESNRILQRLSMIQIATIWGSFVSSLLICTTLLFINNYLNLALVVIIITLIPLSILVRLFYRINRLNKRF